MAIVLQLIAHLFEQYGPIVLLGLIIGYLLRPFLDKNQPSNSPKITDIEKSLRGIIRDEYYFHRQTKKKMLRTEAAYRILFLFAEFYYQVMPFCGAKEERIATVQVIITQLLENARNALNNADDELQLGTIMFEKLSLLIKDFLLNWYLDTNKKMQADTPAVDHCRALIDGSRTFISMAQNILDDILN